MRALITILVCLLFFSCNKDKKLQDSPPPIEVDNTWQCIIEGKLYKGVIDTSFYVVRSGSSDTVVTLTGSTEDGNANIAMKIYIDRTGRPDSTFILGVGPGYLNFDTVSLNYLSTQQGTEYVAIKVEAFQDWKIKGSFSGKLVDRFGSRKDITNGSISLELGKGNHSPKFMGMTADNKIVFGPIRSVLHKTNTLVIDGFTFNGDTTYQLQIRTGGTIRPGVYRSVNGDVGLRLYRPSIITQYVSDSLGDLSVTIQAVEGNIITGTFEGKSFSLGNQQLTTITKGSFKCKVKDYLPSIDSSNLWKFSLDNHGQPEYVTAGGNIISASIAQSGGRYILSLRGNSDNGSSLFNLTLNSWTPITTGIYPIESFQDSLYLSTPNVKYFNRNSGLFVQIDSLNSTRIVGRFFGQMIVGSMIGGSGTSHQARKGLFRSNGHF